ncbi:DUF4375 domain-containing protein [Gordonia sp. VNQ95]|uniref:DMP19 family protein n=1 Tax=Gordonia sp. VNQ95 TaxID=3156619 RepID=UPI0032B3EA8C
MDATRARAMAADEILHRRWGEVGFGDLDDDERETLALWWLEADTANGGFEQFLWNSAGDLLPIALSGLRRVGAEGTLTAVTEAVAVLGPDYPADRMVRDAVLADLVTRLGQDTYDHLFDEVTDIIADNVDNFLETALLELADRYGVSVD